MKVLITNIEMDRHSGTTLYVKELALRLQSIGLTTEVYTLRIGAVGQELLNKGIKVSTSLDDLETPDIIHAHHNIVTWPLFSHFKDTPVIFWIHNRLSSLDIPPKHKNIMAYIAVDHNCLERYIKEFNFSENSVAVIYNWVNLRRFAQKQESLILPKPRRALVFSNYAKEDGYLPAIREACKQLNMGLDVIGAGTKTLKADPENYLHHYDLVFAKAKAAMEALAVGCAVCVCDYTGLAGLVTPVNYDHFRRLNFGMKLMREPITANNIMRECAKYDKEDLLSVSNRLRAEADFELIFGQILNLYKQVESNYARGLRGDYGFSWQHYLKARAATFRIWAGIRTELQWPTLHRLISNIKT